MCLLCGCALLGCGGVWVLVHELREKLFNEDVRMRTDDVRTSGVGALEEAEVDVSAMRKLSRVEVHTHKTARGVVRNSWRGRTDNS